jgi:hypothetical protein
MAMQCSPSSSSGTKTPEVEALSSRYHVRNTFLHLDGDEHDNAPFERKIRSCPVSRIGSGNGLDKEPIVRDVEVLVASTRSTVYDSADNSCAHSLDGDCSPELLNEKVMFLLSSSLDSSSSASRLGTSVNCHNNEQVPRTASTRLKELEELHQQRRHRNTHQRETYSGVVAFSNLEEEPPHGVQCSFHIPSGPAMQIESMLTHWQGFDVMLCQLYSQDSDKGTRHVHFTAGGETFDFDFGLAPPSENWTALAKSEAEATDKNAALKAAAPWRLRQAPKTVAVVENSFADQEPSSDREQEEESEHEEFQQPHVTPHYSIGSVGHEAGTCRPCAFLYTKGCENGAACEFCHLCERDEKKKRRKAKLEVHRLFRKERQAFTRSYRAY